MAGVVCMCVGGWELTVSGYMALSCNVSKIDLLWNRRGNLRRAEYQTLIVFHSDESASICA